MIAVGLDACPGAWVAVVLRDGAFADAAVLPTVPEALRRWPDAAAVGVDIPIGLPDRGASRRADAAARAFVGSRRSSVWPAPPAAVLALPWAAGLGVSRQAHGMGPRIREVEEAGDGRLHEVHPEVTFAHLAERAPLSPKRTWHGLWQRVWLLDRAGVRVPGDRELPAAPDDVLDAAAVAWSALRVARGEARTLPVDARPGEPVICY